MTSGRTTTALVNDILNLLDKDWIAWANVLELLGYARGLKPVVRLAVNAATSEVLADFCRRQQWPCRCSDFWLEPVFHTNLNDTFTRLVYGDAPDDCIRVLFVGHEAATRRAEELEAQSDQLAARELAMLYGFPQCCTAAYAEVQGGVPWLNVFLRASDLEDRVYDWRGNKAAYLFPPHHTLIPEYFPCACDCEPTAQLAQSYEEILCDYGLQKLMEIIREGLMRPLLFFGGSVYRFGGLEFREGWYHVIGSTERHVIDVQTTRWRPDMRTVEALRVDEKELTVRDASGEWREPLAPARTQLLRFA